MENDFIDKIGINFKLNTNDLYIVSAADNDYLKWHDIIKFSFGIYIKYWKNNFCFLQFITKWG